MEVCFNYYGCKERFKSFVFIEFIFIRDYYDICFGNNHKNYKRIIQYSNQSMII